MAPAAESSFPIAGKSKGKPNTKRNMAVEVGSPADDMGESLGGMGGDEEVIAGDLVLEAAFQSFYMLGLAFEGVSDA